MNILLLSSYDAVSHRQWREGLVDTFPEHDWVIKTMPPRHFSWRLRGAPLHWAEDPEIRDQKFDRVVCTGSTDLAALKGLVPALAPVPASVFFHDNQFAYPTQDEQRFKLEAQMLNLYALGVGDRIGFNSNYNRQTLFDGVRDLLDKLPDYKPRELVDAAAERSVVLPVGLQDDALAGRANSPVGKRSLKIVWNHRWEYDKGPELLLSICRELRRRHVEFRLSLLGQQFRRVPESITTIKQEFATALTHAEPIKEREDYLNVLRESDVVLSTARHDFQGLAVLEAVACGCRPVVPAAMAYPEYLGKAHCYEVEDLRRRDRAKKAVDLMLDRPGPLPSLNHLSWSAQKEAYARWLDVPAG